MSPQAQILLYGASNLWLSRRAALDGLVRRFVGPLEIGLANGPGRSYGLRAGNPVARYLPLSEVAFPFDSSAPVRVAFVTDIGNDVAYGQPPERILRWVRRLLDRLENEGYRVIVGGAPVQSLRLINTYLFSALARLYYPQGTLSLEKVASDLEQVDQGVFDLCRERTFTYLEVNPRWYSWDRFHLKLSARQSYWDTLLRDFPVLGPNPVRPIPHRRFLPPERYWLFNKERTGLGRYLDPLGQSTVWVK